MNLMISQPRYMPALNYLHRISVCDAVVYLDNVQYTPRDWENRNKIKTGRGWMWLSVPVVHDRREQLIKDTRIDNSFDWRRKHIRSISQWYSCTPYFDRYFPRIEAILGGQFEFLIDLNRAVLDFILAELRISCRFLLASEMGVSGRGADLLLAICRVTGASTYVSGPFGRRYIDDAKFRDLGIDVFYHEYNHPPYPQPYGEFQPFMAAVDLLFNCGDESRAIISRGNISKEEILERSCSGSTPR